MIQQLDQNIGQNWVKIEPTIKPQLIQNLLKIGLKNEAKLNHNYAKIVLKHGPALSQK